MLIFLDFDGVLNNTQTNWKGSEHAPYVIDPTNLANLERLVRALDDVSIVISSTWRITNTREYIIERLGTTLGPLVREDWCTKRLGTIRGLEVREYLGRHFEWTQVSYMILDDDQDFLWHQPLIHTNNSVGLTMQDVQTALASLGERHYAV